MSRLTRHVVVIHSETFLSVTDTDATDYNVRAWSAPKKAECVCGWTTDPADKSYEICAAARMHLRNAE